jgi:hypothetical protein
MLLLARYPVSECVAVHGQRPGDRMLAAPTRPSVRARVPAHCEVRRLPSEYMQGVADRLLAVSVILLVGSAPLLSAG